MKKLTLYIAIFVAFLFACESSSDVVSPSNASVGGSLARFTIMDETLIAIDQNEIKLFEIAQDGMITFSKSIEVGSGLETLFPKGDFLFIGTRVGMHIYRKAGRDFEFISFTEHLESCDPVVANETHAYVTLRNGRSCSFGSNLLDVYSIEDISSPQLIQSIDMEGPKGLSLTSSHLYVCDGEDGITIFEILEDGRVKEQSRVNGFNAHDAIVIGQILIIVADDNIYQFQILATGEIEKVSEINL
jgi:hypothetical protein